MSSGRIAFCFAAFFMGSVLSEYFSVNVHFGEINPYIKL